MIINMLYITGLLAGGYLIRQLQEEFKVLREQQKEERADQEIVRMTSGWAEEPEVAVDSEEIKPSWRERLADWWANTQPRDTLSMAGTGFTSATSRILRSERPRGYRGLHRAPEGLEQHETPAEGS
jgi:hypothetical protein